MTVQLKSISVDCIIAKIHHYALNQQLWKALSGIVEAMGMS